LHVGRRDKQGQGAPAGPPPMGSYDRCLPRFLLCAIVNDLSQAMQLAVLVAPRTRATRHPGPLRCSKTHVMKSLISRGHMSSSLLTAWRCARGHGIVKFPITIAICGDPPPTSSHKQSHPCLAATMWNVLSQRQMCQVRSCHDMSLVNLTCAIDANFDLKIPCPSTYAYHFSHGSLSRPP
jgi:hypothetical protein